MSALRRLAAVLLAAVARSAPAPAAPRCLPAGAAAVAVPRCLWRSGHLVCPGFPPRAPAPGTATLRLPAAEGNSSAGCGCVTLAQFHRVNAGTCVERLHFRDFVVGWAVFDPSCVGRDCPSEVYILESVAALNPLRYDSASKEFWNFTSPVFREDGFLIGVNFNSPTYFLKEKRCSITLANMYYLAMTSIEKLELFNNDNISTNLKLGLMPKLKELTIANSTIQHFPEDAHVLLPALESLVLKYSGLSGVPAAVARLRQLRRLDLSGARLGRLAGQLPALPRLSQLSLRGARLCCLHQEPAAFRGVPSLQLLDLSYNRLTSLGAALRGLHRLTFLDVSNNQLHQYPELRVNNCTEGFFAFANNHLRTLPDCNNLCQTSNALYLDVQNNQISSWDGSSDMLRCLSGLDLSNNSVSELSAAMLRSLGAVRQVALGGNPLRCRGCALARLQRWLLDTRVEVRAARCAEPANVAGLAAAAVAADPGSCPPPPQHRPGAAVALGLSLAAAAVAAAAAAALCYRYRFELAYGAHLLRMRVRARRSRLRGEGDAGSPFLFDAFILYRVWLIGYSGNDRAWVVGTLVPLLERGPQQYRICLHERDFQLGTVIVQNISSSLDRSRHTIVVLSKSFLSSRWCRWEMDLANHRTLDPSQREFIILLELEPLERALLPRHLRFLMDTRTYLEWHQPANHQYEQQAFRRLKRALGPSCFACSDSSRC